MCAQMSSPGDNEPPKEWWFENACRIAAFRLRKRSTLASTLRLYASRFAMLWSSFVSFGRDRTPHAREGQSAMMKSSRGNRLTNVWSCPHCTTEIDTRTFRLSLTNSSQLVCPNRACARKFALANPEQGQTLARTASLQRFALSMYLLSMRIASSWIAKTRR